MTTDQTNMTGDEIENYIVSTRLQMLYGLKIFLMWTLIASIAFAWYQSNIFLLIASPLMSFFEGIRRSKAWMENTKKELNISEESIMRTWNWYQHTQKNKSSKIKPIIQKFPILTCSFIVIFYSHLR